MRGPAENSFEVKGGVLYRVYKHPYVNSGKPLKQVIVPVQLRSRIMNKLTDRSWEVTWE